ncbi:MAG TPA: hypothetical protein VED46_06465 [Alphaproteobacteria bacterium]|nr:hypothetical protein [Alphaproteobacteria bacterium]
MLAAPNHAELMEKAMNQGSTSPHLAEAETPKGADLEGSLLQPIALIQEYPNLISKELLELSGSVANLFRLNEPHFDDFEAPPVADEPTAEEPSVAEEDGHSGTDPKPSEDSAHPEPLLNLPQSIAEALSRTLLPKLDELMRPSTECCARLEEAIERLTTTLEPIRDFTSALPGAAITEEVDKQIDQIEDELKKATKPDIFDQLPFTDLSLILLDGLLASLAPLATLMGAWVVLQFAHLREVYRRFKADPSDLKNWSAERLEGLEQLAKRYPDSETDREADPILAPWFAQAWSAWSLALRDLIGNIELPESTPEAERLREESLRVLPDVVEDVQRAIDLFQRQHPGQTPNLDRDLLERAIDLLRNNRPAFHESQYQDSSALYSPASYSAEPTDHGSDYVSTTAVSEIDELKSLMRTVLTRLQEPVRLEIRVLDDRVIARRLDGNRGVSVDFSRGPRLVGYMSV